MPEDCIDQGLHPHQSPLAQVEDIKPEALQYVLLDLPGLLFFTTYTLLVLFWAEIYHQARRLSSPASSSRLLPYWQSAC